MEDKIKVIAYVRLVNKEEIEEGKSALSLKIEKVNIVLNDNILGTDPDVSIEVLGVEE